MIRKLALLLLGLVSYSAFAAHTLDSVVAIVNDGVITEQELTQRVNLVQKQLGKDKDKLSATELRQQVLDRMILDTVQRQQAEQSGIQVDDIALDQAIIAMARENNLTLHEFRESLAEEGVNYTDFREDLRQDMMISQLQKRDVASQITLSEQELDTFLRSPEGQNKAGTEYRVSHILLPLPPSPTPEEIASVEHDAEALLHAALAGEDFSDMAMKYSKGQQSLQGGDLGWRRLSELPHLFTTDLLKMQVGEVGTLYRNASGYHLIKLLDKRQSYAAHNPIRTHVRHILIKTDMLTTDEDAQTRLNLVSALIDSGQDFTAVAQQHSDDEASRTNGGDLGWLDPETLPPEFRTAMNALPLNTLSAPIETAVGWHLIEVLDRRELTVTDEMIRERAGQLLRARKFEERLFDWQRQLRDQAFIEVQHDASTRRHAG